MLARASVFCLLCLALLVAYFAFRQSRSQDDLIAKIAMIGAVRPENQVDCALFAIQRPLVILALGQSNAGNHGDLSESEDPPVAMQVGNDCAITADPLPGATGNGGSIWRHLPALLSNKLAGRKIVLSVLAVDATTIDDWTRPGSVLAQRLVEQIQALRKRGMDPDFVLWQQGEADARIKTSTSQYLGGLMRLASLLDEAGTHAPLFIARSTTCRSVPSEAVRSAVDQAYKISPRFLPGPDTDLLLSDAYRRDGCHLNASGLRSAAGAWTAVLKQRVLGAVPAQ